MRSRSARPYALFLLLTGLTATAPALAYIDPNAGGLLFQVLTPILALLAAAATFARRQIGLFWLLLSRAFRTALARLSRADRTELE